MTNTLTTINDIVSALGKRRRKSDWKKFFGNHSAIFEDTLRYTGCPVRCISCGSCGCNHELRRAREGYLAVCQCTEDSCEDIALSDTEAEAWEFSDMDFAKKIAKSLSLTGDVSDIGDKLFDLGRCPNNKGNRHVLLCLCNETKLVQCLAKIAAMKDVGCVLAFRFWDKIETTIKLLGAVSLGANHVAYNVNTGVVCQCNSKCQKNSPLHDQKQICALCGWIHTEDGSRWEHPRTNAVVTTSGKRAKLLIELHRGMVKDGGDTAIENFIEDGDRKAGYQADDILGDRLHALLYFSAKRGRGRIRKPDEKTPKGRPVK